MCISCSYNFSYPMQMPINAVNRAYSHCHYDLFFSSWAKASSVCLVLFIKSAVLWGLKHTFSFSFFLYTYFNKTQGLQLLTHLSHVFLESTIQVIGCWNAHWHVRICHSCVVCVFPPTVISKLISCKGSPQVSAVASFPGMELVMFHKALKNSKHNF